MSYPIKTDFKWFIKIKGKFLDKNQLLSPPFMIVTIQPPQLPLRFDSSGGPAPVMPDTFEPDIVVPTSFTPATEFDETDLETKWKSNAKSFFEDFSGSNYQKLRGGTYGGLLTKEEDVAEDFRDWGQFEDFMFFRIWLDSNDTADRGNIANRDSQEYLDKLTNPSFGDGDMDGNNSETINFSQSQPFTAEHRNRIQENLQEGGAVVLSFYHYYNRTDASHIVTVREVSSEGLVLDDPFGQINPEYRRSSGVSHAFKDEGKTGFYSQYDWRNDPVYNATETDYSNRDFTSENAEELGTDERRGGNSVITWDMLNGSTKQFIRYIVLYNR